MGRISEGHENFVADDMSKSLDYLNEAFTIEREIAIIEKKLKDLKGSLLAKKRDSSKLYNKSKRNFPREMFDKYADVMREGQIIISNLAKVNVPKHRPLIAVTNSNVVDRKIDETSIEPIARRMRWSRRRKELQRKENWNLILKSAKAEVHSLESKIVKENEVILPVWNKNEPDKITIFTPNERSKEIFQVYNPGYSPNPFEDFMLKL